MDQETKLFTITLKNKGHFVTKPRVALFKILQRRTSLSVGQLIRGLPRQDQATVYRNIKLFEKLGIIRRLQLGWHSKLELSDKFHHHHHHMTCSNCGKVWALKENPVLEKQINDIAKNKRFLPADHQLEIRGLCQACQVL